MIAIKWKVEDGKTRPALGMPKKGEVYSLRDTLAHSYVSQNMASYVNASDKPKSKVEEK